MLGSKRESIFHAVAHNNRLHLTAFGAGMRAL